MKKNTRHEIAAITILGVLAGLGFLLHRHYRDGPHIGYINTNGDWVIQPRFRYAQDFVGDFALVSLVGQYTPTGDLWDSKPGIIDRAGNFVIPPDQYDWFQISSNGLATVRKGEKTDVLDIRRNKLWGMSYSSVGQFKDGRAVFVTKPEGLQGYINDRGEQVIQPQYKDAHDFRDGLARVYGEDWGEFIQMRVCDHRPDLLALPARFERATCGLGNRRSIHLSYGSTVLILLAFLHVSTG